MDKELEWIIHLDQKYYMNVFGNRTPVAFKKGKGVYLYSTEGKEYMDLLGGIAVNVLGHGNKKLAKAISTQASNLIHCSSLYYIESQAELAKKLVDLTFADRAFFGNSGAEANEGAIKLARAYFYKKNAPRTKIVTALKSFHGRTLATATATGQTKYSAPFAPLQGFTYVPYNDIDALEKEVDESTCAVMLELIQGESGVLPATKEYIEAARKICDEKGAILIFDEVQTGVGRTGKLYAYENYGVAPDILTSAKGLAGGVPIGAILATEDVASAFAPGDHGSTFGGNPLATSAALAVIDEIEQKFLCDNAAKIGEFIRKKLSKTQKTYGIISDIRGQGLLIGIEFNRPCALEIKNELFEKGYLTGSIGDNILRIAPPLIISKREANNFTVELTKIIEKMALSEV